MMCLRLPLISTKSAPPATFSMALRVSSSWLRCCQQGGFAAAIRADDADAVATQDGGGSVAQNDLVAERLRHPGHLDHLLARSLRAGGFHLDLAGQLAPRRPFHPHGLECTHAAFVAGATGLDALPDPHFFLRQQLVEAGVFLCLRVQALLAPTQVVVVIAGPTGELATVDLDDAGGERTQEAAVVGDEDQTTGEGLEKALQPVDGLDVEVVGGLVQQQDVGRTHQGLAQQHAPLHAAGQRGEFGLVRQVELFQYLCHPAIQIPTVPGFDLCLRFAHRLHVAVMQGMVVGGQQRAQFAQPLRHHVEYAALGVLWHFLRHPRDHHAALQADFAVVRFDIAADQAHQGGLAGAVAADDANAFARIDAEIDLLEQQRAADAVIDVLEMKKRHPRSLRGATRSPSENGILVGSSGR